MPTMVLSAETVTGNTTHRHDMIHNQRKTGFSVVQQAFGRCQWLVRNHCYKFASELPVNSQILENETHTTHIHTT